MKVSLRREKTRRYNYLEREFFKTQSVGRHGFRVTEQDIEITRGQHRELQKVASVFPHVVNGMSRVIALSLVDDKLRRKSPVFRQLRNALNLGSRYNEILKQAAGRKDIEKINYQHEAEILNLNASKNHPIARFDLVSNTAGDYKIVEIEEAKTHGFGYTHLGRALSGEGIGSGLVNKFVEISKKGRLGFLLSKYERFYLREADYFVRMVNKNGGDMVLIFQDDFEVTESRIGKLQGGKFTPIEKLLSLPLLDMSREPRAELERIVKAKASSGQLELISYPEPILSQKSAMAVVSNAFTDLELESILLDCFDHKALRLIRGYLPKTFIARTKVEREELIDRIVAGELFFVKESNSSGARGVASYDDKKRQIKMINSGKLVIAQEAVSTEFRNFSYMDFPTGKFGSDYFSIRYGLFTFKGELLDVGVTASVGNIAHGSRDSIQTGIKLKA